MPNDLTPETLAEWREEVDYALDDNDDPTVNWWGQFSYRLLNALDAEKARAEQAEAELDRLAALKGQVDMLVEYASRAEWAEQAFKAEAEASRSYAAERDALLAEREQAEAALSRVLDDVEKEAKGLRLPLGGRGPGAPGGLFLRGCEFAADRLDALVAKHRDGQS